MKFSQTYSNALMPSKGCGSRLTKLSLLHAVSLLVLSACCVVWYLNFPRVIPRLLVRQTPHQLAPRLSNSDSNVTPPFVFQVALGEEFTRSVPWGLVKSDLLKYLPPHYEYRLFDGPASEAFIQSYYPEHLALFRDLHHVAHRSDMVRYLLLYKYGGLYIDVDLKLKMSLSDIFHFAKARLVWFLGHAPYECLNGFIIAPTAGDVLFLHLVEEMYEDHARAGHPDYLFNVKRLYRALSQLYPGLGSYASINGVYFGQETLDVAGDTKKANSRPKYSLSLDPGTVAMLANGHLKSTGAGEEK